MPGSKKKNGDMNTKRRNPTPCDQNANTVLTVINSKYTEIKIV